MESEPKILSPNESPESIVQEVENLTKELYMVICPLIGNFHPLVSTNAISNMHAMILCELMHGFMEKNSHKNHIEASAKCFTETCLSKLKELESHTKTQMAEDRSEHPEKT